MLLKGSTQSAAVCSWLYCLLSSVCAWSHTEHHCWLNLQMGKQQLHLLAWDGKTDPWVYRRAGLGCSDWKGTIPEAVAVNIP